MNAHASLLGFFEPGDGWLFRLGVGWKYLLLLVLGLVPIIGQQWWLTLAALALTLGVLASSGIGPRRALRIGGVMWAILGFLAVFHLATLHPVKAVVQPGNLLVAILAARIVTLTTPTPVLMDALSRALRPLRFLGLDTEQAALALALMIRSIPYLLGSVGDARDAARARGRERNPARLLTPVLLGAVAYAERTGEALHARGIGERADLDQPGRGAR